MKPPHSDAPLWLWDGAGVCACGQLEQKPHGEGDTLHLTWACCVCAATGTSGWTGQVALEAFGVLKDAQTGDLQSVTGDPCSVAPSSLTPPHSLLHLACQPQSPPEPTPFILTKLGLCAFSRDTHHVVFPPSAFRYLFCVDIIQTRKSCKTCPKNYQVVSTGTPPRSPRTLPLSSPSEKTVDMRPLEPYISQAAGRHRGYTAECYRPGVRQACTPNPSSASHREPSTRTLHCSGHQLPGMQLQATESPVSWGL